MVLDGTRVSIYDTEPREGRFWVFCGYSNADLKVDTIPHAFHNEIIIIICNFFFYIKSVVFVVQTASQLRRSLSCVCLTEM